MTGRVLRCLGLVVLATMFMTGVARAQLTGCSMTITEINFGVVDTLSGAPVDVSGTASVTCIRGLITSVVACISVGVGSGGLISGTRQMRNAANAPLSFQLFQDPARMIRLGSVFLPQLGSAAPVTFGTGVGSSTRNIPIYARIPANQQSAAPGAYVSAFSGAHVALTVDRYIGTPPDCSTVTGSAERATFNVRATVAPNCLVTAQNIDFGEYGVLDTVVDATGGLDVTCTPGTAYQIALNNGLTGTGPTDRRMTLGNQSVVYGLYRDAAGTQPWGTGGQRLAGTGAGTEQSMPVYGRVPPQPTPAAGTYTDTVVVTVTY